MPMLEWNENLSIHVVEIDSQHQELVDMVNTLYDSMVAGADSEILFDIIDRMLRYTDVHFGTEETYMSQYAYPETAAHKADHADFMAKAAQVAKDHQAAKLGLSMDVLNFLGDWLVTHINGSDKRLGKFLESKGIA